MTSKPSSNANIGPSVIADLAHKLHAGRDRGPVTKNSRSILECVSLMIVAAFAILTQNPEPRFLLPAIISAALILFVLGTGGGGGVQAILHVCDRWIRDNQGEIRSSISQSR